MEKTIIFLQQLLECTAGIPLACIAYTKADFLSCLQGSTGNILDLFPLRDNRFWQKVMPGVLSDDAVYECALWGGITFMVYPNVPSNRLFILGPVRTAPFSREDILRDLKRSGIKKEAEVSILQLCSTLPVVAGHILYRTADLVAGYLSDSDRPLRITKLDFTANADPYTPHSAITYTGDIMQMREVEMRYEYSAALTDAVKQGNLSLALHIIGRYIPGASNPARNANPLRNAQNYCIVLNTQLRHALEETGIHPYRMDRLSNEIGVEIEQLKKLTQLPQFLEQVIRRYCRLVQEHTYPNLKPLTNLAVTYIKEHLTENITVKDTAKALTVNANYLSTLFHQEMGMTFIDFVNKERTSQAATLLKHTNLQIQQIASSVGYNNTSYFAKQFLRFQGKTPSDFRKGV